MLKIVRSPAKVSWNLLCNNIVIQTGERKELMEVMQAYASKYGLKMQGVKS